MLYLAKLKYAGASAPGSRTPRNTCTIHMRMPSITTETWDDSRCSDGSGRAEICWIPRHLQSPAVGTLTRQQLFLYREGKTRLNPHPWLGRSSYSLPSHSASPHRRRMRCFYIAYSPAERPALPAPQGRALNSSPHRRRLAREPAAASGSAHARPCRPGGQIQTCLSPLLFVGAAVALTSLHRVLLLCGFRRSPVR